MVSSGESTRIEDCSKVVFVAALSQEVPIKKEDENQSDDTCSFLDVNRYVQEKPSVTSTSYNTSHNGPNVQPVRLDNGERANSNNRARLEYRGNSVHSRMRCSAVGCSIIGVSDRQKGKSRRNKPSDLSETKPIKVTKKGMDNDFASHLQAMGSAPQGTAYGYGWIHNSGHSR